MKIDFTGAKRPGSRPLKALREKQGLEQHDVAERMGVPKSRVSYLEQCDPSIMQLRFLQSYIEATGARLTVAIEFDGEQTS